MTNDITLFDMMRQRKSYGTATIDQLLEHCAEQIDAIYSTDIIPLLQATKEFRDLADPGPFFSGMRNELQAEAQLSIALEPITTVLARAEKKINESMLLDSVLAFCAESVSERLRELAPDDNLSKLMAEV